jgi:hypothetical protein
MTAIARLLPASQRTVAAFDANHVDAAAVTRSANQERAGRSTARKEYAWIEQAAMAGTRTPRG